MRKRSLAVVLSAVAVVAPRLAQGQTCVLPPGSHEARLLAFYEAPLAFSPATAPEVMPTGAVRIGFEIAPLPTPSADLQRTGVCYIAKAEHTQLASIFPRPRVTVGLPAGFIVEGSYDPPVPVGQANVNVASFGLANARRVGSMSGADLTLMLRAQGTVGHIRGPITCPSSALQLADSSAPCFGSKPSNDTFQPVMFGTDATIGASLPNGRFAAYVGGGFSWLRPRFTVDFSDVYEYYNLYHTHLLVDLTRATVQTGLSLRLARALDFSTQLYIVPKDATTFRFGLGYHLGPSR